MATHDSRHKSIGFGCAVALVLAAGPLRSVSIGTPVATSCDSLKATALPHTIGACDARDSVKDGLVSEPTTCVHRRRTDQPRCTALDRTK